MRMPTTLINVSNRLPVTVGETIRKSSGGLVAALEGLPGDQYRLRWLGWPGGDVPPQRQEQVRRQLESEYHCVPVFLSHDEAVGHYEGLSNSSIWPLLHYMPTMFRYDPPWWDHYVTVNRRFAEHVLREASDGDVVWVHDYQLMLLPALLKHAKPTLRVGFFLHTPFPSYEVFRCHPRRQELAEGIMGADLIGFHTYGYLRHYRSTVLRLLGLDSEMTRIRHEGHESQLGVYPIGINAPQFQAELDKPEHREQLDRFRQTHGRQRVILSVERLDYTKGILRRLDAIDLLLSRYPNIDELKFIFISIPSREGVEQYRELREEVERRIGRLNGKYATLHNSPIHFIHGSVSFTELTALYALADVCLVTPLIDGMNLVAKEYVACQRDEPTPGGQARSGALVLSEFAGAAEELFNALLVNPYDPQAVADAITTALAMDGAEKHRRMSAMRTRVMEWDAGAWARTFLQDLAARPVPGADGSLAGTCGDGDVREAKQRLAEAVRQHRSIALFLDYDGSLREIERNPWDAFPNPPVLQLLERLSGCPNVDLTIISGRAAPDLEKWLGHFPIGLIAEHGAALRRPHHREWEHLDLNVSYGWKDELIKVLRAYAASTPGSFVEDKRTSLVWHYRRADPEFGGWKAKELASELAVLLANDPVEVRFGRKIVEVTAAQINKGAAVLRALQERRYDLIVAAGDDTTDESMFRLDVPNLLSIKVGRGDTMARYRVASPQKLREFLAEAC